MWDRWTDDATGYACKIGRSWGGIKVGYVAVPSEHPFHNKSYEYKIPKTNEHMDMPVSDTTGPMELLLHALDEDTTHIRISLASMVHGGITFADTMKDEDVDLWWFGFDCGHCFDEGIERSDAYLKEECAKLAAFLKKHA